MRCNRFPTEEKCPICGTNENKECLMVAIEETQEGNNAQARFYHIDCLRLSEKTINGKRFVYQIINN